MPRTLGWVLILGGVGYLVSAFVTYLAPDLEIVAGVLVIPATIGEFWMIAFLLFRGSVMMYTSLQGSVMLVIGLLTSVLTQTRAPHRYEGFVPSRELSEAVADPDATRWRDVRVRFE